MKVEIWSDILCPFCYIGKRKFEKALAQFSHREEVEVIWHSFQLMPELQHVPGKNIHEVLSESKGWSLAQARQMNEQVTAMAREVGLDYRMDQAVPANTFDAHQLLHLAQQHGLQDAAKERLLRAYFTEGKNIGDLDTLVALGQEIGLDPAQIREALEKKSFAHEVQQDIFTAQQIGVRGVPFFVLNGKYGVSGAQPSEHFLQALNQVWEEEKPKIVPFKPGEAAGPACTDETC